MRTRFAPSPTGFLHIGGLRTALYAYLVAKQTGGEFLLRIEDTDQERNVPRALENILSTLHFAGLDPDEGVMLQKEIVTHKGAKGPYIQSERLPIYKKYAQQLQKDGYAYPCFCTQGRLNQMRKDQKMTIHDKAVVSYQTSDKLLNSVFEEYGEEIKKGTLAVELKEAKGGTVVDIGGVSVALSVEK